MFTKILRFKKLCNINKNCCRYYTATSIVQPNVTDRELLPFEAIPGPKRIPFIGSLNDILTMGPAAKLHETIDDYHKKYGPIFRIKIGVCNSIFLSSPDFMRSVFLFEGKHPKHPLPEAWTYYNEKYGCKRGLFFMDDEEWLSHRTILNNFLLKDVQWMTQPIEINCDLLINHIKNSAFTNTKNSKDFYEIPDLEKQLYQLSIEVILSLMLGTAFNTKTRKILSPLIDRFAQINQDIFEYSSQLASIPPRIAEQLQFQSWKSFVQSVKNTLELGNEILDYFLQHENYGDGLLKKMREANINDENVSRIFVDFLLAAGDTSSFATQWSLYLLAKHQKIQEDVREGIRAENNVMESSLMRATVRESLRLYPVAPFIGRILATDGVIGHYKIPQNTLALLSLYSSGRDPNNFSNPTDFLPSRWSRQNSNQQDILKPQASLPFAIGARSCIGRKIANIQVHTALTKILNNFEIKLNNKEEIHMKLKLVSVPSDKLKIGFKALK